MESEEITQEAFDKLRERVQVLEELIFVEMKLTVDRTDISACEKVNKFKAFIEQVREEEEEEEDEVSMVKEKATNDRAKPAAADNTKGINVNQESVDGNSLKRPAPDAAGVEESPEAKAARLLKHFKTENRERGD